MHPSWQTKDVFPVDGDNIVSYNKAILSDIGSRGACSSSLSWVGLIIDIYNVTRVPLCKKIDCSRWHVKRL
jgi:hypothetical protein